MLENHPVRDAQNDAETPLSRLTLREREVADYLTHGRSNKYIAVELGVTQRTIEAHRARIFQKLRVRNAVELTRYCLSWRSGDPDPDGGNPGAPSSIPAPAPGFIVRRRFRPVSRPARGWGRYPPGGSTAIPAGAACRSPGSRAARSTG